MKDRIVFRSDSLTDAASEIKRLAETLDDVAGQLSRVDTSAGWWSEIDVSTGRGRTSLSGAVQLVRGDVRRAKEYVTKLSDGIIKARDMFEDTDEQICKSIDAMFVGKGYDSSAGHAGSSGSGAGTGGSAPSQGSGSTGGFWEGFMKGGNRFLNISNAYGLVTDAYDWAKKTADSYDKYMKIGRAVGKKQATQMWLKNAFGLTPMKGLSRAGKFADRVKTNLTGGNSPFRKKLSEDLGDFAGKGGKGKCAAKWAGVALDGAMNFFGNKREQAASNGTMSDGRVIAETISETVVGGVINYGAKMVVGAAVAAALPVTAPAVVITAASTALVIGTDMLVEKITGQGVTEWVSDGVLYVGEAVVDNIGKGAKKAASAVSGWFKKIAY